MLSSDRELLDALRAGGGVLTRRERPDLLSVLKRHQAAGDLVAVLPGVLVPARRRHELPLLARAACRWRPDVVVVETAAARMSFWPEMSARPIELAVPARLRLRRPQFRIEERRVPPELVREVDGVRFTVPALTALDLCPLLGGDGIDRALRQRAATLDGMRRALDLTGGRRDNACRRQLLLDSRDHPWSAAERRSHRLLRAAGITNWTGNVLITLGGRSFYLDIAFDDRPLAIEIDGRQFHGEDGEHFEADRWRQNLLLLHGWLVLRFTWRMLVDEPEAVIAQIREAYQMAGSMRPALVG